MSEKRASEAWQVRVHGVGGPQGRKMLGVLSDDDTEALGPDPVTGEAGAGLTRVPSDTKTRVMRRPDDHGVEAYEWGGLTLGSTRNALWVVYLPLTILNASGWSHKPGANPRSRALMHIVCGLGTLTYVGWIGYLLLDLVGRQWRDRLVAADLIGPVAWIVGRGLYLAHALFAVVLYALWKVNRRSGAGFEGRTLGEAADDWEEGAEVFDPRFFGHEKSYARLAWRHVAVALAGAAVVVWLGSVPRQLPGAHTVTSIGPGLLVLAAAQCLFLLLWWVTTLLTRDFTRVATASLGTVLSHATFVGIAITGVERLSGWPRVEGDHAVVGGAEVGLGDYLLYAVAGGAVAIGLYAVLVWRRRRRARPGYDPPPTVAVRLAHAAPVLATLLALGFVGSLGTFLVLQAHGLASDGFLGWYEGYRVEGNAAQALGGLALGAIPVLIVGVLKRPREGAVAQVLGNIWDVLTFWPRRFHPLAVPPYSERAVPELRWIIRQRRRPGRPLVIVAHSQGSVLSFAAIGAELSRAPGPAEGAVSFLGFGSPVGSLFASMFPAYFGPPSRGLVARLIEDSGGRWWNLFRATDPISGPVVDPTATAPSSAAWFDTQLPDPRPDFVPNPVPLPVPLERARPWGVVNGHNFYLADPTTKDMVEWLRTAAPVDPVMLRDA
ncbi:MAG: hypothetical protein QOE93_1444 [Actinomycetota bacterium]|nr:hypothetical protein [Actinomycetota bacterium]